MRARLETAAHFCEVVVLKSASLPTRCKAYVESQVLPREEGTTLKVSGTFTCKPGKEAGPDCLFMSRLCSIAVHLILGETRRAIPVELVCLPGKVDVRLPGKGNSKLHGARPVYLNHLDD